MDFGINQGLVEELYQQYLANPTAVDEDWRSYFEAMTSSQRDSLATEDNGNGANHPDPSPFMTTASGGLRSPLDEFPQTAVGLTAAISDRAAASTEGSEPQYEIQERMTALVNGYRMRGHRMARLDPLGLVLPEPQLLSLERFGLANVDPTTMMATGNFAGSAMLPLGDFVERLSETYCRTIGVEFRNIEEPKNRAWLQNEMESTLNHRELEHDQQVRILAKLIDAEIFEQFLHTKYVGAKRFSLEGGESVIPLLELMIDETGRHGIEELVIGMAHRGRLNVLANVMEKNLEEIFAAFEDENPDRYFGGGDVKYHLGYSGDRLTADGHSVHLTLSFNPSHLEFVNPVVEGRVRAKQDRRGDMDRSTVVPLLIHGDAAVIGQGVVAETINLSGLRGYATGGTIHVVLNNQIGFTTAWEDSRSSRYCTDIMRMLRCPIFHVNGEDPEAVAQVVKLAMDYRQRYMQDVVIDMYCYRRYGHNEADEPRFTQPLMYSAVDRKPSVREVYVKHLVELGSFSAEQADELERSRRAVLEQALEKTREQKPEPQNYSMQGLWAAYQGGADIECPEVDTSVPEARLAELMDGACATPEDFNVHPKLVRLMDMRREQGHGARAIDWGGAETLAYASLVTEGTAVRLSGQDSRRGTFSHRHAVLHDNVTGRLHTPLAYLSDDQARFEVWDSPLSEAGVLGFEYGYSLDSPDGLIIWEAQFGDFCNGAQVIIDQFLSSSEDKWYRLSGLVLLLPHGFEGQGPEHSSARLERWLSLCAEDNMQVCNLTTAAQFFHVLRRQVARPYRKPLIIMSPKSLLRSPLSSSTLADLSSGGFERIIADPDAVPSKVRRVLLCSGKVYYDLAAYRQEHGHDEVAIIRVEQIYPLNPVQVRKVLSPFGDSTELVWVQEEPRNMGAWYYMRANLPEIVEDRLKLRCVARTESASPATGSMAAHKLEQAALVAHAVSGQGKAVPQVSIS